MSGIITGLERAKSLEERVKNVEEDLLVLRRLISEIITGIVILSGDSYENMQADFAEIEQIVNSETLSSIDVNNLPDSLSSKFSRETIVLFCLTAFQKMLLAVQEPSIKRVNTLN